MFKTASFSNEIAQAMLQNEQRSATSGHYISEQEKINSLRQLEIQAEVERAIRILADISLKKDNIKKEAILPAEKEDLSYVERIQEKLDTLSASPHEDLEKPLRVLKSYFDHIIEQGTNFSELVVIDEALDKLYDKFYGEEIEVILGGEEDESDARDKKKRKTKEEKDVFKHYGFGDRELEDILADLDD